MDNKPLGNPAGDGYISAVFHSPPEIEGSAAASAVASIGRTWQQLETERQQRERDTTRTPDEHLSQLAPKAKRALKLVDSRVQEGLREYVRASESLEARRRDLLVEPANASELRSFFRGLSTEERDIALAQDKDVGYQMTRAVLAGHPSLSGFVSNAPREALRSRYLHAAAPELVKEEARVIALHTAVDNAKKMFHRHVHAAIDFKKVESIESRRVVDKGWETSGEVA